MRKIIEYIVNIQKKKKKKKANNYLVNCISRSGYGICTFKKKKRH